MVTEQEATRPRFTDVLARLAMASGVGYLAAAYSISRRLTRAVPCRPATRPENFGLVGEALECRTADGIRLRGWCVTPLQPQATIILCHGMRRNREHTLDRLAFLVSNGYRCVAFDHRAHGESAGRKTSFGFHEGRDVEAILALVKQRWTQQPQAALGISMGAAALCFAASHTRNLQAIVLESLYHDIGGAFANRIGNHYPPWFERLSNGVIWVTERRLGVRLPQLSPADYIGQLSPAPVLLVTGTEDSHASPAEARRLYDRCRGPRELCLVPGASHRDLFEKGGAAYRARLLNFLERNLACRLAA